MVHEVGHSLGAEHDHLVGCDRPPDDYLLGPDIMYYGTIYPPYPVTGRLSRCSRLDMRSNFLSLGRLNRSCFVYDYSGASRCGDGIVDVGEECDCGDAVFCTLDYCCERKAIHAGKMPRLDSTYLGNPGGLTIVLQEKVSLSRARYPCGTNR